MSFRTVVILILALVCGLSAAVGVNALRRPAVASEAEETVSIAVAAENIPRFTTLAVDMVKTQDYPKSLVPTGALTSVEDVFDRVAAAPLLKDEPILDGKLAGKGQGRGMAAGIPDGMQAYTIPTATVSSGVAGFILPGNKVDVLLTVVTNSGDKDDPTGGGSTTPLLQAVEILAVGQRVDVPTENKINPKELRSVTLLVTPRQAAMLALGQSKGVLHLSLRNPNDPKPNQRGLVTMNDIRFLEGKPVERTSNKPVAVEPPPPPPPLPLQIRTLRGNQEGVIYIQPSPHVSKRH